MHAKWTVSVKVHMQERHANFIDSGGGKANVTVPQYTKGDMTGNKSDRKSGPKLCGILTTHVGTWTLLCVCFPLQAACTINSIMTWSSVKVFFFVSFPLVYFFHLSKIRSLWLVCFCACAHVCVHSDMYAHTCKITLAMIHGSVKSSHVEYSGIHQRCFG